MRFIQMKQITANSVLSYYDSRRRTVLMYIAILHVTNKISALESRSGLLPARV